MNQTSNLPNALFEQRNRRLLDQVALKETDRIPFVFGTRFWAAKFSGISFQEQMYDVDKSLRPWRKVQLWLERTAPRRRSTRSVRRWTRWTIGY
jgi:hypothetical protein